MPFKSKFKLNAKLQACAVNDQDHIGEHTSPAEHRQGAHVGLIQEALNAWAQRQTPPVRQVAAGEAGARVFGPDTARLVTLFKTRKNILNFAGKIDPIVGKNTVAALDLELPALPPDEEIVPPIKRKVADIVVRFQGARAAGPLSPDSVLRSRLVLVYKTMPDQPFGNKVMLHPSNGRALLRVGRQTTTIGAASRGVFATVVSEMMTLLAGLGMQPGKIFIHGSSSGGRNAIDFAAHLTGVGLRPHFVVAVDAAFFQADTASRPEANVERPRTVPEFAVNAGTTPNRHNFFQTLGNHAKRSVFQGVLFTSKMGGEEIHGRVAGFRNTDLTPFMPRPLLLTDDEAHEECGRRGVPEAERLIADELLLGT